MDEADVRVERTPIPGLLVVRHGVQHNDDGWFKENWQREKMASLGLPDFDPVQQNVTHVVSRGITRGFLAEPWDRLVGVLQGRAMGAWVDLRAGDGFGRTYSIDLDRGTSVFVPRGVANGHQVLEDGTTFNYLLEHHWTPQARERAATVDLFDPDLSIPWPIGKERAIVAHRDRLHPRIADARAMHPRRSVVVGTETSLGRALLAALPGADGLTTAELAPDAATPVDLSAYDVIINAHGDAGSGLVDRPRAVSSWAAAAARAHRLTDIARRHHLRYVHVSADCVFEHPVPEQRESDALSLMDAHGQALAAAEIVAAGVPRHFIVRTGWVVGGENSFVEDVVVAARRGRPVSVVGDRFGRLTFASQLAAGITHLLEVGAPAGTYNITGDGRVVTWADVARRVVELSGGPADLVREVPSPEGPDASPASSVLGLEKIRATGFRPGNSWLELIDHLPEATIPRPGAGSGTVAAASAEGQATGPEPFKVLFVCTANIARSAYADVVARGAGLDGVEFSSAGTRALVGEGIDPPMAEHVAERGDAASHRARQLNRELVTSADLILTMGSDHRRYILDEWPSLGRKAFVMGHVAREMGSLPEGTGLDGLVDHLWRHRTTDPADDVADPYGRGEVAASAAAEQIDDHLAVILEGLKRLSR